jgi:sodium transport system ATP-binding protein
MTAHALIKIDALCKTFYTPEPVQAVREASFQCHAGEVFGLLGPNGAGKTTLLRMLSTLLQPDSGSASIAGIDVVAEPARVRGSIGFLSTSTGLYERLSAREMIEYFARLQGVDRPRERTEALIKALSIQDFADQRCGQLSTGMKQKVSIARAIVHDPPVLIFDEPTTGLDVIVSQTLLDFIDQARQEGRCILFSTHIMSQAERLCDRFAIIDQGQVQAQGTLEELRSLTDEHYLEKIFLRLVDRRL